LRKCYLTYLGKVRNLKVRGPRPPRKKWGSLNPCGLRGSATYEPTYHLVLLDILFVLFQVNAIGLLFANSQLFILVSA